ncbi:MAG: hypothetical protein HC828_03345 [Blastochloris sp.]|nr:hypothetical protein [Blastochloris sp.]
MQLTNLYGTGGGRIPLDNGASLTLTRAELAAIIAAMPMAACREMHIAARKGDTATAQRILREAAVSYKAAAPAPAPAPVPPFRRTRRISIA